MSDYIGFDGYMPGDSAQDHAAKVLEHAMMMDHVAITNPCAEIPLAIWGGFCLIGDVVPYHAMHAADGNYNPAWMNDAMDAGREMARFLIRTNLMRSLYKREVERTNRIGVGLTGVHEFAWKAFGLGFRDLLDPRPGTRAAEFWRTISEIARATIHEADQYSQELGLALPETVTTIKPSGTVSKLWALTEGWHLPAMPYYLRWVQFTDTDHLVDEYEDRGYPVRRNLRTYKGVSIVGFPTITELARIMPPDKIVTAGDATFEEQARWVELGEHYWLSAGDEAYKSRGGQISYTLKYNPAEITHADFHRLMSYWMPRLKTISVMPQVSIDQRAYEYLPEEPISAELYADLVSKIDRSGITEDIDKVHIDCDSGACPVEFNKEMTV
jgi:hypothetical protein